MNLSDSEGTSLSEGDEVLLTTNTGTVYRMVVCTIRDRVYLKNMHVSSICIDIEKYKALPGFFLKKR